MIRTITFVALPYNYMQTEIIICQAVSIKLRKLRYFYAGGNASIQAVAASHMSI